MEIPNYRYAEIRDLNVDEHNVVCEYSYWEQTFKYEESNLARVLEIKESLGSTFNRADLVAFYGKEYFDIETKFLAAMIWGYEAPEGSRRDNRGPSRLQKMLNSKDFYKILKSVKIGNDKEIQSSYSKIKNNINGCGPSFLTKHLYFLGKSSGESKYPLIFDNRVAVGLARLSLSDSACLDIVSIQALPKRSAYIKYLEFARNQSTVIDCDLDQIEYFLFRIGGSLQ